MLPRDVMEVFELGRKQWRECKPPVEVGPGDSRFLPALAASKSGSCNDKQRGGVCFHGSKKQTALEEDIGRPGLYSQLCHLFIVTWGRLLPSRPQFLSLKWGKILK